MLNEVRHLVHNIPVALDQVQVQLELLRNGSGVGGLLTLLCILTGLAAEENTFGVKSVSVYSCWSDHHWPRPRMRPLTVPGPTSIEKISDYR